MKKLFSGNVFAHRTKQKIKAASDFPANKYALDDDIDDGDGDDDYHPNEAFYKCYHPLLKAQHIIELCNAAKDWQTCHGMMLKAMEHEVVYTSYTYPIGITLMPSPFPAKLYHEAHDLQPLYNKLYMGISSNPKWLRSVLRSLIESDPLTSILWSIYEEATAIGVASRMGLGIFRSDYMLFEDSEKKLSIKQIEMNTIACAGSMHGEKVTQLHRHLQLTGAYDVSGANSQYSIPTNENCAAIVQAIKEAHDQYTADFTSQPGGACILMLCQPFNFNVADERPIEFGLWAQEAPVPTFRVDWGPDFLSKTELTDDKRLLYRHSNGATAYEVSVVYLRAGFQLHEFENYPDGVQLHIRIEVSKAIKCPPILAHMATLKKVQQSLTEPGVLEEFLSPTDAHHIRDTFVQIYPLDDSKLGLEAQKMATNRELARAHVLKPSLEGGGNNIYGENIPDFLQTLEREKWEHYILMKLIKPPRYSNLLMSNRGVYQGEAVCELGIWGTCLWRMPSIETESDLKIISNCSAGWSVRTKRAEVNELSVVKGFGCFDSLHLVADALVASEPHLDLGSIEQP